MLNTVHHSSNYKYHQDANYSVQAIRLWPVEFDGQKIHSWDLKVENADLTRLSLDGFGNLVYLASLIRPHSEVHVEARGEVEVEDRSGIVTGLKEVAHRRIFLRNTDLTLADGHFYLQRGEVNDAGQLQTWREKIS